MGLYRLKWNQPVPQACRGCIVAIGNFDGVHCGHGRLLSRVRARARAGGAPAVALSFDPHPLRLLRPAQYQPPLTTPDERSRLLHEAGADHVVFLQTDSSLLQLSARDFFLRVIWQNFAARGIVEGPNFGFGRNREGNVQTLSLFATEAGMTFEIVEPLQMDGGVVSSNRVRCALLAGDVSSAERWLGRPYRLAGTVVTGARRGQQIGFPTANLAEIATLIPGDGVYAAKAYPFDDQGDGLPAAVNIGPNPTFGESARKVEAHVLGFEGELYGRTVALDFLARLRDTRRFESPAELIEQLKTDVSSARNAVQERLQ